MVLGSMRSETIQQNYKPKELGFSTEARGLMFMRMDEERIMNRESVSDVALDRVTTEKESRAPPAKLSRAP